MKQGSGQQYGMPWQWPTDILPAVMTSSWTLRAPLRGHYSAPVPTARYMRSTAMRWTCAIGHTSAVRMHHPPQTSLPIWRPPWRRRGLRHGHMRHSQMWSTRYSPSAVDGCHQNPSGPPSAQRPACSPYAPLHSREPNRSTRTSSAASPHPVVRSRPAAAAVSLPLPGRPIAGGAAIVLALPCP